MHDTMKKFGYPQTLLKEFTHWVVLLRPMQPTLGSLVLICKEEATAFSSLSQDAFTELGDSVKWIEHLLSSLFEYQKINYLMLMMADKEVHYNVLPRYEHSREFASVKFEDKGWPGLPDLLSTTDLTEDQFSELLSFMKKSVEEKGM